MRRHATAFLVLAALSPAFAAPADAQEAKFVGDFGAWAAYTYTVEGSPACYIASKPTSSEGEYDRRGEVFALVTHRVADDVVGEVSIVAGYEYQGDGTPRARIGSETFEMFARGDTAWLRTAEDARMVAAMRRGTEMVVTAVSNRGTKTVDTYSLMGFTKAYEAITRVCKKG
ncbi:invasion protein IalB [Constrictibacter sp. MBR-5]|jgi:invasion protein IalB|uniref:invasion associated locus B family protein n=1 Tax=Constrictibacter sp. MBR-5 TaxID=3156467 RepID=UPI003395547D